MTGSPGAIRAVFFDVDFTLIYPGPTFQGEGYRRFCARHGLAIDASRFDEAVAAASYILDEVEEPLYDDGLFVHYTATIIERMGGQGAAVMHAAREIYAEWATNHHFEMYDDVGPVLRELAARALTLGVISNSHRSLDAFKDHFALNGIIHAAVSSAVHGYMKPHPSIFERALADAGVRASEAVMVGDSLKADVEGALGAGMRAVLLRRSGEAPAAGLPDGVPVIRGLHELTQYL
ncbi:MAG: HAD family hydrolase [Vicinamibacteria bacterium]